MKTAYGDLIKFLRDERSLSQTEVAAKLEMSRASYIALERGSKELTLKEAVAVTTLFGITIETLLATTPPHLDTYKEMIRAFLRLAATDKTVIKKTKLAKLLYLADFGWYYLHRESLSNLPYRKCDFGPTPDAFFRLLEEMELEGIITVTQVARDDYHMYEISETRAAQKQSLIHLSKKQQTHVEKIWTAWAKASTAEILKFTNEQAPYQEAISGEILSYDAILSEEAHNVW